MQINLLEGMAKKTAAKREKCMKEMEDDLREIAFIDQEIASIMRLYEPLCKRQEERKARKVELERALSTAKAALGPIVL